MSKLVLVNVGGKDLAVWPPHNLLILAAYAKKFGHEVIIADQPTGENIFKKIESFKPDFVGITGVTRIINESYKIADWCKEHGYTVILGGVHVTIMPDEGLKHADYVVFGEGEKALVSILDGKETQGIVRGECIRNLDELPRDELNDINMDFYTSITKRKHGSTGFFVAPGTKVCSLITSRGCPFNCIYCYNSYRANPVRFNSAKRVIEEMTELETKYGVKAMFLLDDDFLVSRARAMEFCKLYKESGSKMLWYCQTRVVSVDLELLKELKSVNCMQISYGLESGSPRILKLLKNGRVTVEQNMRAVKLCKEAGILTTGTFMIGSPYETEDDIELTKKFIIDSDIDVFVVSVTTPYPGTKLWDMCKEAGIIPEKVDYEELSLGKLPSITLCKLTPERIQWWFQEFLNMNLAKHPAYKPKWALISAFMNPKWAIKRILVNPKIIPIMIKRLIKGE